MALVPSVRWPCSGAFARARSCPFQKNMPPEKPKWCVEDDEEVIEMALYLGPVAGRATTCGKAKYLFSVPPARGRAALCFFAEAKNQDDSPCGLQLDAELSNPNPGSEAFHGGQASPEAHRFTPRAHGQPGGAEAGGQRPAFPARPTCDLELSGGAGLDQRLQGVLVDGFTRD